MYIFKVPSEVLNKQTMIISRREIEGEEVKARNRSRKIWYCSLFFSTRVSLICKVYQADWTWIYHLLPWAPPRARIAGTITLKTLKPVLGEQKWQHNNQSLSQQSFLTYWTFNLFQIHNPECWNLKREKPQEVCFWFLIFLHWKGQNNKLFCFF